MLCILEYTGTAALHTHRVAAADADGDNSVIGDAATTNVYYGRAMVATKANRYVKTTTAQVTSESDSLRYSGISFAQQGSIAMDLLKYIRESKNSYGICVTPGDDTQRILAFMPAAGELGVVYTKDSVTTANMRSSTNFADGKWHEGRTTFRSDEFTIYVDGVRENVDPDGGVPDPLTQMNIGEYRNGSLDANGNVRIRLFPKPTTDDVTEFE